MRLEKELNNTSCKIHCAMEVPKANDKGQLKCEKNSEQINHYLLYFKITDLKPPMILDISL
jgi:hypothetical protein